MLTVQYALQLKSEGFIFMPLSPGVGFQSNAVLILLANGLTVASDRHGDCQCRSACQRWGEGGPGSCARRYAGGQWEVREYPRARVGGGVGPESVRWEEPALVRDVRVRELLLEGLGLCRR